MLSFFFFLGNSLRPVVLLPGLYGSSLTATYEEGYAKHWYCPKSQDHEVYWFNYKYLIPPTYNCLFEMLQGYYDEANDVVTSPPGLTVDVPDWGGEEGIAYVDSSGILGMHFIESFHSMLEYLKDKGYTIKKDLYGAPYDWRLAMVGIESNLFPKLKSLIEEAYTNNENQKVVVLGYSCGGIVIQRFFSKYVDQTWKDTYIQKAIFLAPAFAGSPMTVDVAWNRYFPILPSLKLDSIEEAVETVPCIHTLFPNPNVFGDLPIIDGPDGVITAKDIPDYLVEKGKFHDYNIPLMRKDSEIIYEVPEDPGVDLMMLYNSKVDTALTMNFTNGYDEDYEVINTEGDGTVPAVGPVWGCNNWKNDKSLICYDVAQADKDYDHSGMSTNEAVLDIIYKYISDDTWVNAKHHRMVTAPKIEFTDEAKKHYRMLGQEQVKDI